MMDLTTSLIGLGIVALIILPLVYFHFSQKRDRNTFIQKFIQQAAQQQVNLTHYDVWSHYFAIGLDAQTNKLFYVKKRGDQDQQVLINLSQVERCKLIHTKRAMNGDQVIDRLALSFTYHGGKQAEQTLEFFNKDEFMTLSGELQLVEKWNTIATSQLEGKKQKPVLS